MRRTLVMDAAAPRGTGTGHALPAGHGEPDRPQDAGEPRYLPMMSRSAFSRASLTMPATWAR